jgi:hypothetical protein
MQKEGKPPVMEDRQAVEIMEQAFADQLGEFGSAQRLGFQEGDQPQPRRHLRQRQGLLHGLGIGPAAQLQQAGYRPLMLDQPPRLSVCGRRSRTWLLSSASSPVSAGSLLSVIASTAWGGFFESPSTAKSTNCPLIAFP